MRIMDVKQFIDNQYHKGEKRHVSHYTRFIDKHVDFVTYFSINKTVTTTSIGNYNVDSYIGKDSPVRYNKINNFPIFGFPAFSTDNDYSEDSAGFNSDSYSGEIIILPEIIEPSEGDCFILDVYDTRRFFIITEVRQVVLKNKSHYSLTFVNGIPDYLPQLKSQVVDEFNAIFDNIGTQDQVIISSKDYELKIEYEKMYRYLYDYYIHRFFNQRTTMFELQMSNKNPEYSFSDTFCAKFMMDNRIITIDKLLKESLVMDYNRPDNKNDYFEYINTLYWAVENKNPDKIKNAHYILTKRLITPFSLASSQYADDKKLIHTSSKYVESETVDGCDYSHECIKFPFAQIKTRILNDDYHISDNPLDEAISVIVRYFNGKNIILPGYFNAIKFEDMNPLEQYLLIPIILFIIRYNIYSLTRLNNIL